MTITLPGAARSPNRPRPPVWPWHIDILRRQLWVAPYLPILEQDVIRTGVYHARVEHHHPIPVVIDPFDLLRRYTPPRRHRPRIDAKPRRWPPRGPARSCPYAAPWNINIAVRPPIARCTRLPPSSSVQGECSFDPTDQKVCALQVCAVLRRKRQSLFQCPQLFQPLSVRYIRYRNLHLPDALAS